MTITPEDHAFIAALEDRTLPAEHFDHLGHVRAAWVVLAEGIDGASSASDAHQRFIVALKRYARHLGAPGKYQETVTRAFLALIEARVNEAPVEDTWTAFAARNADLIENAGALLNRHYSPERLFSDDARQRFLAPDREPLPNAGRRSDAA